MYSLLKLMTNNIFLSCTVGNSYIRTSLTEYSLHAVEKRDLEDPSSDCKSRSSKHDPQESWHNIPSMTSPIVCVMLTTTVISNDY